MTDKQRGFKVTLADYSLTPDVAIVDPQFVMSMPKGLTVDTGVDCLTHALEAGVSVFVSPLHGFKCHAGGAHGVQVPADCIRESARRRSAQHDAQRSVHAAITFSNASVGVNHALAHAFGARFHVPHDARML
jgi:acetaldehyde dehydrogenase/alcohol dehydrogenase